MDDAFESELQARLTVLDDPGYVDPAREDLPVRDIAVLALLSAVVIALMIVWSYPA